MTPTKSLPKDTGDSPVRAKWHRQPKSSTSDLDTEDMPALHPHTGKRSRASDDDNDDDADESILDCVVAYFRHRQHKACGSVGSASTISYNRDHRARWDV